MGSFDRDRIIAQSLGGLSIEGELARVRGAHEVEPRRARSDFVESRARAAAAIEALRAEWQAFVPEALVTDDVLGAAEFDLGEKTREFARKAQATEAFRVRHGLTRAAEEPQTVQSGLLLALMVFVEAVGGTGFLLNAQLAASPLAAILFSLLMSVTNVLISVMAGFHVGRWLHYGAHAADADNPEFVAIRRRARWQFGAFIAVMILLHSTLGLVRAQESLDAIVFSLDGYARLVTTPEALFLVLTGICMSVLAYHKGMVAFADPYPHYSRYHRAAVAAYEALHDAFGVFVAEIETRHGAARHVLDQAWKDQQKRSAAVRRDRERCLAARRDLVRTVDEAESALNTDLARLAETHRAARGDKTPLPAGALDGLASYQSFLEDSDPPAFGDPPDIRRYRADLNASKAAALRTLKTLFESLHADTGGRSS